MVGNIVLVRSGQLDMSVEHIQTIRQTVKTSFFSLLGGKDSERRMQGKAIPVELVELTKYRDSSVIGTLIRLKNPSASFWVAQFNLQTLALIINGTTNVAIYIVGIVIFLTLLFRFLQKCINCVL